MIVTRLKKYEDVAYVIEALSNFSTSLKIHLSDGRVFKAFFKNGFHPSFKGFQVELINPISNLEDVFNDALMVSCEIEFKSLIINFTVNISDFTDAQNSGNQALLFTIPVDMTISNKRDSQRVYLGDRKDCTAKIALSSKSSSPKVYRLHDVSEMGCAVFCESDEFIPEEEYLIMFNLSLKKKYLRGRAVQGYQSLDDGYAFGFEFTEVQYDGNVSDFLQPYYNINDSWKSLFKH